MEFGIILALFAALFWTLGYKIGDIEGTTESKNVCIRMLEYEHHMTREQATQVWSNELKREGR